MPRVKTQLGMAAGMLGLELPDSIVPDKTIEAVCRRLCTRKGVDPDSYSVEFDRSAPVDVPLTKVYEWQRYEIFVRQVLEEFGHILLEEINVQKDLQD